ncbi:MAG: hypothetical protein ACYC64_03135 [Armatimonadota bacterium]
MSIFESNSTQHPEPRRRVRLGMLGLLLCLIVISPVFAQSSFKNHGVTVTASDIGTSILGDGSYKVVADKNAYVKMLDPAAGTFFEGEAQKMIVTIGPSAGSKNAIKSAELRGPVKLVYATCDPKTNGRSTMTATADSATYDGINQIAYLVGNVKIINDNPALFQEPAVMTGDKATINIKPGSAPEFKVESTPGVSRIEVTPKKEATQSK